MNSDETNNIDELLSFLPSFSLTDQNFIVESESEEASSIMAPFDYTDEVNQFVQLLRNEFWTDNYYSHVEETFRMIYEMMNAQITELIALIEADY